MQVTNRQFSIFLWQNPQFIRAYIRRKEHYLDAWGDRLTVDPARADEWVSAPAEVLFLYHTWQRLLASYYYRRPIPQIEFLDFLKSDPEWHPRYWREAPDRYRELVAWLEEGSQIGDLQYVSEGELPTIVRQAFQGWKNFTKESEAIHNLRPTYDTLQAFIETYPNFRRPLWINLVRHERPDYLNLDRAREGDKIKGSDLVAESKLDGLLKMALYNYLNASTDKSPAHK